MPRIHPDKFEQLANLTPPEAASALLTAHAGDATRAERDVWDTWQAIVGGDPGQRMKEGEESEGARICVSIARHIADGTELPQVERTSEPSSRRRRRIAA